ncbi:MAG TPA: CBS domain-containing protein [Casimicrobiaceae bacterium]|nr:CBS domain-containing protein [Casimicrobiaceae bacterium]
MRRRGVRRAPVVNRGGKLTGIVTLDDLLRIVVAQLDDLNRRDLRRARDRSPRTFIGDSSTSTYPRCVATPSCGAARRTRRRKSIARCRGAARRL